MGDAAQDALAALTSPGASFEIVDVAPGIRNFAKRDRSLRDLVARSARHGDKEFLVQGDRRVSFAELRTAARCLSVSVNDGEYGRFVKVCKQRASQRQPGGIGGYGGTPPTADLAASRAQRRQAVNP